MSELAPGFLVAVPQLGDPNFHRAVILLMEHGTEGALGLVVNRTAQLKQVSLGEIAHSQGLDRRPELDRSPVYVGGPVQPERGFVVHSSGELDESVRIQDGLFVSGSMESLKTLMGGSPNRFRLCLGYAGWGPGQLEKELKEGAWIVAPVNPRHALETPAPQAWDAVLRDMGIDPAMVLQGGGVH